MENDFDFTIHEKREMNKISLETYTLGMEVSFDYSIDKLITELKAENQKSWKEHDGLVNLEKNKPNKYRELLEQAERHGIHLDLQKYEYIENVIFNDDQLTVLSEMKIIYAYKLLEVNIKKLLAASFSINTQSFYRWSSLIDFLKEKNIKVSSLNGHKEIIELQTVNNSLKHSDEMSGKVMEIMEFKKGERVTYIELNKFYERIKDFPAIFLSALINEIYNELYYFDDRKLTEIANSLILRMDKETAFKFIEKIRARY